MMNIYLSGASVCVCVWMDVSIHVCVGDCMCVIHTRVCICVYVCTCILYAYT